jgi:hypothetical protein
MRTIRGAFFYPALRVHTVPTLDRWAICLWNRIYVGWIDSRGDPLPFSFDCQRAYFFVGAALERLDVNALPFCRRDHVIIAHELDFIYWCGNDAVRESFFWCSIYNRCLTWDTGLRPCILVHCERKEGSDPHNETQPGLVPGFMIKHNPGVPGFFLQDKK